MFFCDLWAWMGSNHRPSGMRLQTNWYTNLGGAEFITENRPNHNSEPKL